MSDPRPSHRAPPGSWAPARQIAQKALAPIERFLAVQASSGVLLLAAAVVALVWANSPWRHSYEALWRTTFGLRLGGWVFERDLHFWINDGLMTVFFFVVGLEIRREMHRGELSERRRATLPVAAALGGMVMPAIIFFGLNRGRASSVGWGVPMATDIAFAVGVLALLGKRVPPAMRVLLLALAVIDDVGAIIVIALFYSNDFSIAGAGIATLGVVAVIALQKLGVRSSWAYVPPAILIWAGAYATGIHPTLAGVVVGLLTPVRAWFGADAFMDVIESKVEHLRSKNEVEERELLPHLDAVETARREAVSPVERLQHQLHGIVAFAIMPLFALANAGVSFGATKLDGDGLSVFVGVGVGLVVGKLGGIVGLSWIATKLGLTQLPTGIRWLHVSVVGLCGGIGFTMAIFIAGLAFPAGPLLETAKLSILCGSVIAGIVAFGVGRWALTTKREAGSAACESDAEASTTS